MADAHAAETFDLVVTSVAVVAIGIKAFELRSPVSHDLPKFHAGDHIDVLTPCGAIRQYSLYNSPAERHRYCIAVKLEDPSHGGSESMHRDVQVGSTLKICRPRSNFPLQAAEFYLLFAGGIGITPISSMIHQLESLGAKAHAHYFVRSAAHAAFLEELTLPKASVEVFIHEALDAEGVGELFRSIADTAESGTHAYVCGPGPFMNVAQELLPPRLGADAVHFEYFKPREDLMTGKQESFRVRLVKSGIEVTIEPGDTIIEVLARNGIKVATSCQQGVCGTCITKVISGIPEHRDSFLSDFHRKANKKIAICVSRAKSELLELDL
jgi:vanillate O-demethylase ferredoxin subunit